MELELKLELMTATRHDAAQTDCSWFYCPAYPGTASLPLPLVAVWIYPLIPPAEHMFHGKTGIWKTCPGRPLTRLSPPKQALAALEPVTGVDDLGAESANKARLMLPKPSTSPRTRCLQF